MIDIAARVAGPPDSGGGVLLLILLVPSIHQHPIDHSGAGARGLGNVGSDPTALLTNPVVVYRD